MRKLIGFLLACTLIIASALNAEANSLWVDSSPAANLFYDHRAHAVGDVITIIISESSSANRIGSAANKKDASASLKDGTGLFTFINALSGSTSDSFTAKGSLSNTNRVTGRITVKVTEIQPNGQLVIKGSQTIRQNTDVQTITITGIVRSDDVTAANTVLSSNVADAQLKIEGKGPLAGKQRQGILTQAFNFLF
ncbi:Flagellar L-ring protein precursor [Sporomusa ovata DSM 2662]|uniref:Flagellar L-ring protein FlgH n=1 Tax=Sporomusa ovata TaxID=2378 RepID=A0A0U1KT66_9FIRM|nr:flagellar basal body L-ring protein FlgH [Sporomusa ovata]EQB26524.1 flagellar L-ring protein [Sporomusa ovata DSM 2662]CQR70611.1 Flagellar L-ring protein FlgH [Sporomusa ovata]